MTAVTAITTQVATFALDNPIVAGPRGTGFYDNVIVHVDVDEGVRGSSYVWVMDPRETREPAPDSAAFLIESAIRNISGAVVGEDVFAYNRIWASVAARSFQLGPGLVSIAHSGIDMALWDAIGKLTGQPLHRLLGASRPSVPVYSTELMEVWNRSVEAHVAKARELVGRGITAMKMLYGRAPEGVDLERVAAVREAVGPDVGLMVDVAGGWTFVEALRRCRQLEPFGLTWIEDPLPLESPQQLARLCAEIETPIATGERCFGLAQLQGLIEKQALDVLLFEPMRIGGITGAVRLAGMTLAAGIPIAPHAFSDLAVNLMSALPNGMIVEYLPWWGVLMQSPFMPVNGVGVPSERPGIGIDFDLDALERLRTYPGGRVATR